MSKYLPYLVSGGKEKLKEDLNSADEPIEFIKNMSKVESLDLSQLDPFYQMCELTGVKMSDVYKDFLRQNIDELKQKINEMASDELRRLLKDLEPYAEIPDFRDLMKTVLSKCNAIPSSTVIPAQLHVEMKPEEQARLYLNDQKVMYEWFDDVFEKAKYDFDNDDFSYEKVYNTIANVIYLKTKLVAYAIEYCETHFMQSFHPVYSMVRFRIALQDSPIAALDTGRPLAIMIYNSFHGKSMNAQLLHEACKHCGDLTSSVILGIPHMTIISKVQYYGEHFGIEHKNMKEFFPQLVKPKPATLEKCSEQTTYGRVALIAWIQGTPIHESILNLLIPMDPQEDLGKIMCRNYKPEFEPLLQAWAEKDPWIYIDYITCIKARNLDFTLVGKPDLNPIQSTIVQTLLEL